MTFLTICVAPVLPSALPGVAIGWQEGLDPYILTSCAWQGHPGPSPEGKHDLSDLFVQKHGVFLWKTWLPPRSREVKQDSHQRAPHSCVDLVFYKVLLKFDFSAVFNVGVVLNLYRRRTL